MAARRFLSTIEQVAEALQRGLSLPEFCGQAQGGGVVARRSQREGREVGKSNRSGTIIARPS